MELCKQLNYFRSFSAGKAYFYYLDDNGAMLPLKIDRTRLRASKGGYSQAFLGDNFEQKNVEPQDLAQSNIQYVEECYVPPGVSHFYCAFSMRIRANSLNPDVCSSRITRAQLVSLASTYKEISGYSELALRYAKNILLGHWLWRNRECRGLEIEVLTSHDERITIEGAQKLSWYGSWGEDAMEQLNQLTAFLKQALSDPSEYFYMDVKAKVKVGWGDEIYPSQEFQDSIEDGQPKKVLAKTILHNYQETVVFHAQKIGAAVQLIDDWWGDEADKPLRVNEYGADREYVIARRHPMFDNDFYQLVRRAEVWAEGMKNSETIPDDVHYIMSVLVKGGLFNCSRR